MKVSFSLPGLLKKFLFNNKLSTMDVEQDILDQLKADFSPDDIQARLEQLTEASGVPRIQRCIVFASRGHPWYFDYLCRLTKLDFRDVIMAGEYERLNARLYDFNRPIPSARINDPYAPGTPDDG